MRRRSKLARPYIWRLIILKVTWNHAGVIMFPGCNHGLGRWCGGHGGAEGEVAGAGPARAGGGSGCRCGRDLGRAPRTIDAYARGLAEYLEMCERDGVDPVTATRAHVAVFVRELTTRPSRRGRERGVDRLGGGVGERHAPAATGGGAVVLRLPDRGGAARVEPGRPRPIHTRRAVGRPRSAGWCRG